MHNELRLDTKGVLLRCPICDDNNTHVGLLIGDETLDSVNWDGKIEDTSYMKIPMYGECGHPFILIIEQHKGETYFRYALVGNKMVYDYRIEGTIRM